MDTRVTGADFAITVEGGKPIVVRHFKFADGSAIDFSITLPEDYSATLLNLHRRSVEHAVTLLQEMLKPK
jgi:hypothetical protein